MSVDSGTSVDTRALALSNPTAQVGQQASRPGATARPEVSNPGQEVTKRLAREYGIPVGSREGDPDGRGTRPERVRGP
jgi:hypothetical protein